MSATGKRRVVVTGIGAVTPLGNSLKETWSAAIEGRSGIGPITLFDTKDCPAKIAGEVKDFNFEAPAGPFKPSPDKPQITHVGNRKDARKMGRFIRFAMAAGLEAYGDSGIDAHRSKFAPERFGANVGVGMGGLGEIEATHSDLINKGFKRISPFFIPQVIANLAGGQLSIALNLKGPNMCNVTACASSAHAIGESYRFIQSGLCDVMMTGGAEAVISPLGIGGFAAMKALSTRNDAPEKASRPFDVDRDGFVMGEGSCCMILEEYEFAKARGAKIYAEVKGYGLSGDAYHMTTPSPGQEGGFRSMEMALKDSGLKPEDIHYVNAHGTSTPAGDAEEAAAVKQLFPDAPKHLKLSATKSMTGHLLGAAGAIEAAFSMLAMRDGVVPPTINLDRLDEACAATGIDFTANKAQKFTVKNALSNSFGFGGTNASLILGEV